MKMFQAEKEFCRCHKFKNFILFFEGNQEVLMFLLNYLEVSLNCDIHSFQTLNVLNKSELNGIIYKRVS